MTKGGGRIYVIPQESYIWSVVVSSVCMHTHSVCMYILCVSEVVFFPTVMLG